MDDQTYRLQIPPAKAGVVGPWLRDLSDGYTSLNLDGKKDFSASRMPGPFVVADAKTSPRSSPSGRGSTGVDKPWFIGDQAGGLHVSPPPSFKWVEPENPPIQNTRLHDTHKAMGAKMVPFAGWDMPVWYSSGVEENLATRHAAGLFDVSHMGVYEVVEPYIDYSGRVRGYGVADLSTAMGRYDWRWAEWNVWKVERVLIDWPHVKLPSSTERYRLLKRWYREYRAAHGDRKPIDYRGREKWSPLPDEFR